MWPQPDAALLRPRCPAGRGCRWRCRRCCGRARPLASHAGLPQEMTPLPCRCCCRRSRCLPRPLWPAPRRPVLPRILLQRHLQLRPRAAAPHTPACAAPPRAHAPRPGRTPAAAACRGPPQPPPRAPRLPRPQRPWPAALPPPPAQWRQVAAARAARGRVLRRRSGWQQRACMHKLPRAQRSARTSSRSARSRLTPRSFRAARSDCSHRACLGRMRGAASGCARHAATAVRYRGAQTAPRAACQQACARKAGPACVRRSFFAPGPPQRALRAGPHPLAPAAQ